MEVDRRLTQLSDEFAALDLRQMQQAPRYTDWIARQVRTHCGRRVLEVPIPTYYGDEICRVNGIKYAWDVTKAVVVARSQQLGLLYDRRFDVATSGGNAQYEPKLDYPSPHSAALELVPAGARVLDLGCAGGYVGAMLRQRRGCRVTGVDKFPLAPGVELDRFILHDLNDGFPPVELAGSSEA